ncbi:MAG: nucleoside-diphosphate sugar epimerase [Anaerolineae bacterium SG8_19]|jgi:uncharacterized protein YbjT (DUF2867 family)|nr:MAG: nucleoside-diphosphate sugar epimerase [Anaerolineae bacterium SG8_19]
MSNQRLVLVTGATGSQGGSVVQALLERGHKVRGMTRNADSSAAEKLRLRGVEVVAGDFIDQDSLVRAANGVDTVFTMTTPFEEGVEAETAQGIAITNAAKEAGVGHLIYSSVANADKATGIPHFDSKYEVEKHIASSGLPYTIIAPVYFMENLTTPWSVPGLRQGKLALALPADQPLQQIAVRDIGAFAAAVIERRESVFGHRYDIAGDEISGEESAAIFSEATGRKIQYESFPPDALRAQSEDMALMFEWLNDTGYSADIAGLRRDFPEVTWLDFATWIGRQDWSVLDSPELPEAGWGGRDDK